MNEANIVFNGTCENINGHMVEKVMEQPDPMITKKNLLKRKFRI